MAQAASSPSAVVHVEVHLRRGSPDSREASRPAVYEVGDGGFLIGSVPGCDLRLPGTNLAPVLCLIARQPSGASLRKLAPVQPIAVNGRTVASTYLSDGDRITLGAAELIVRIHGEPGASAPGESPPAPPGVTAAELLERARLLEMREERLREQVKAVEAERTHWLARREEIEMASREQIQRLERLSMQVAEQDRNLDGTRADLQRREQAVRVLQEELTSRSTELESRCQELTRQEEEVTGLRQEMDRIRQELAQRYQKRRDKLIGQQQAVRKAARRILERKHEAEEQEARLRAEREEWSLRRAEHEAQSEQLQRERQLLDDQHKLVSTRQQEVQRELAQRLEDLEAREKAYAEEKVALERGQKQHQADLVRLDRIQATIDQKQKALEQRALEIDRKFEQLQRDTRDLEEQAGELDDWHTRLTAETERLEAQKQSQQNVVAQLDQRAAALEGQQAMLATLRTRMERMRDDLRREEQAVSDQRALLEASEADIKTRLEEAEKLRSDLASDKQLFEEEHRRFEERRTTLEQAVTQLRQAQDTLTNEEKDLRERREQTEATAAEQNEQAALLLARAAQVEELQQRLQTDRQTLRERETTLTRAEQTLASLQEQVRRRSEQLNAQQEQVEQSSAQLAKRIEETNAQLAQRSAEAAAREALLDQTNRELDGRAAQLGQRDEQLATKADVLRRGTEDLEEGKMSLASQRQALASERLAWEVERQAALEQERQTRAEFAAARQEAQELVRQMPGLELRAGAALERLSRAREHLREHLAEVHTYARQSREDLEAARKQVQSESDRVRQQELNLQMERDEHRVAVAGFRQQLMEWQIKVDEIRQTLSLGKSELETRQSDLQEQARHIADTSARLAVEAEELQRQQRQVAERRGELDRHLTDMREWYRRKMRELAGVDAPAGAEPGAGDVVPMPYQPGAPVTGEDALPPTDDRNPARAVLTLTDEIEPADRQLGELLATLELVDGDTLQALWAEARRQRRSLRQLLLAQNYLTLYQMALIEAGNLDGLVLGPVRVIDRLPLTPREAAYRVFDPRRNTEALLRHLAESEVEDAVHPDEFRQRFAAATAVQHGNVAGVLEVMEIAGRPAALLEWVNGLPGSDWPGLAAAPGVWYRVLSQAAMALNAAHEGGLYHGHLEASSFVLTPDGTVKLTGLGEPVWLASSRSGEPSRTEDSPARLAGPTEDSAADMAALGRIAAVWATTPAAGSKSKPKPLPEELQAILARLQTPDAVARYPSAQALVEDLERAGAKAPASTAAWDRLLRQVREQSAPTALRESA
jgi:chromosome segregation ATPase